MYMIQYSSPVGHNDLMENNKEGKLNMKKIVCIALTLIMALSSVSVLAEGFTLADSYEIGERSFNGGKVNLEAAAVGGGSVTSDVYAGEEGRDYTDEKVYTFNDYTSALTSSMNWDVLSWETNEDSAITDYIITGFYGFHMNSDKSGYSITPEAAAEMPVLDHLGDSRVQIRGAPVMKVRGGKRGVVHGARQQAMVDSRVRAAGPQPMAGAAHQALRHLRAGEPPVIEQPLADSSAIAVVGEHAHQWDEQARAGRVDAELPVDFLTFSRSLRLGPRPCLRLGLRLRRKPPLMHAPCDERHPRQGKRRACAGDRPFHATRHNSTSSPFGSGGDTPSRRSISGNSGDHTRAEPYSERKMARHPLL